MYYLQGSSPSILSYLAYLFALSYVEFTFIVSDSMQVEAALLIFLKN